MIVEETSTPPPAGFVASSPFTLRDFEVKAMYVEEDGGRKWYQLPSDTAMATVQWRAVLTNGTQKTAGCRLQIRLFDEDGFSLEEISYEGAGNTRDFEPGKPMLIAGDTQFKLGAVKHLKQIKVIATQLPSSAEEEERRQRYVAEQMEAFRAEREAERREDEARRQKQEAERIAVAKKQEEERIAAAEEDEARRQKQERDIIVAAKLAAAYNKIPNWDLVAAIKEEKVKWDSLYIGMTMQQVEDILGKPEEKSALGWRYSDGSYVSFFMERVQSWGRK